MGRRKMDPTPLETPKRIAARTPEARENQLVSMAYDLAEQRLRDGTASSAEVVQIMKWGSQKEKLERELAETKIELMKAKKEAIESAKRIEDLYTEAMSAFRRYNGVFDENEEDNNADVY